MSNFKINYHYANVQIGHFYVEFVGEIPLGIDIKSENESKEQQRLFGKNSQLKIMPTWTANFLNESHYHKKATETNKLTTFSQEVTEEQFITAYKEAVKQRDNEAGTHNSTTEDCINFNQDIYRATGAKGHFINFLPREEFESIENIAAWIGRNFLEIKAANFVTGTSENDVAMRYGVSLERVAEDTEKSSDHKNFVIFPESTSTCTASSFKELFDLSFAEAYKQLLSSSNPSSDQNLDNSELIRKEDIELNWNQKKIYREYSKLEKEEEFENNLQYKVNKTLEFIDSLDLGDKHVKALSQYILASLTIDENGNDLALLPSKYMSPELQETIKIMQILTKESPSISDERCRDDSAIWEVEPIKAKIDKSHSDIIKNYDAMASNCQGFYQESCQKEAGEKLVPLIIERDKSIFEPQIKEFEQLCNKFTREEYSSMCKMEIRKLKTMKKKTDYLGNYPRVDYKGDAYKELAQHLFDAIDDECSEIHEEIDHRSFTEMHNKLSMSGLIEIADTIVGIVNLAE